jgi:hypothetical protein
MFYYFSPPPAFQTKKNKIKKMHYLPLQCILRKSLIVPLSRKLEEVILPRHLSKVEAAASGLRVRIFPTQTFHLHSFDWNVHWRQHLMPHNGEMATTIQTTCYNSLGRMLQFESITYLSSSFHEPAPFASSRPPNETELYQASYLLQEVFRTCSQIPLTEPQTLEWHRFHLLERLKEE